MNVEIVPTEWFNAEALRLPNYKVGRVNFGGGRSYIRLDNECKPCEWPIKLYTSLTTAINQCAPMERPLLEWYCKNGLEEAERKTEVAAHYGTLMHLEIGKWLINGEYDFGACEEAVEDYLAENSFYQPECKLWGEKLKRDIAAFTQFYFDYQIRPLGIEYVLLSERGYGTLIDLVCEMTIQVDGLDYDNPYKTGPRKGEPRECKVDKKIRAIINFKSGRHGFYRTNGLQIEAERQLWEENFPDLPLDAAFNWSPKDWTGGSPTYNFKDWTGEITTEEVEAVMMLADIRYASKAERKQYTSISGVLSILDGGLEGIVKKEGISEYVGRKFGAVQEGDFSQQSTRKPDYTVVNKPISEPLPI